MKTRRGNRPFAVALSYDGDLDGRFGIDGYSFSNREISIADMDVDQRRRVVLSGTAADDEYALIRFKPAP